MVGHKRESKEVDLVLFSQSTVVPTNFQLASKKKKVQKEYYGCVDGKGVSGLVCMMDWTTSLKLKMVVVRLAWYNLQGVNEVCMLELSWCPRRGTYLVIY